MDDTSSASEAVTQGADDPARRDGGAPERAMTAPDPAWPIRAPRSLADFQAGRVLGGMSYPGGDIPCRWIPPEYAEPDGSPEATS
jgi:hypothetical protein